MWEQHDNYMKQLKQLYNKTSKQTQNKMQEIFDIFTNVLRRSLTDFDEINVLSENFYNVTDSKNKKRINTYIERLERARFIKV